MKSSQTSKHLTTQIKCMTQSNLSLGFVCLFFDTSKQQMRDGFIPVAALAIWKSCSEHVASKLNLLFLVG